MVVMSSPVKTEMNVLLIDNPQRLFSCSRLLPELRKNLSSEQVFCMAAHDSFCGLQLCRAFEMDLVVVAVRQSELLRTMILQIEQEFPGVVVLVVGKDSDRVAVDDVLRETGSRWIAMQSEGEVSPSMEIERRVREIRAEKLKIGQELSKQAQGVGSRVLIRLNATHMTS